MNWIRVFFIGGITSYRALFHWLSPWIFVPMLIVAPLFQLLFFAYLGRATGVESDTYFIVGNALLAAALPGLWGMSHSISAERRTKTLGVLLSSPASRLALFLGRALPTILNGFVVSAVCLAIGSILLTVQIPRHAVPGLALAVLAAAFSCAALGLIVGALGLRGRSVTTLDNLLLAALLLFAGVNVPLARLPDWMQTFSGYIPLTHGIDAARRIVAGGSIGSVKNELLAEAAVGACYALAGAILLRAFEYESRRSASLETY